MRRRMRFRCTARPKARFTLTPNRLLFVRLARKKITNWALDLRRPSR